MIDAEKGVTTIGGAPVILGRPLPKGKATLAARPETIRLGRAPGKDTVLAGKITGVNFLGSVIRLRADVGGQVIDFDTFNAPGVPPPTPGTEVELSLSARDLLVIPE